MRASNHRRRRALQPRAGAARPPAAGPPGWLAIHARCSAAGVSLAGPTVSPSHASRPPGRTTPLLPHSSTPLQGGVHPPPCRPLSRHTWSWTNWLRIACSCRRSGAASTRFISALKRPTASADMAHQRARSLDFFCALPNFSLIARLSPHHPRTRSPCGPARSQSGVRSMAPTATSRAWRRHRRARAAGGAEAAAAQPSPTNQANAHALRPAAAAGTSAARAQPCAPVSARVCAPASAPAHAPAAAACAARWPDAGRPPSRNPRPPLAATTPGCGARQAQHARLLRTTMTTMTTTMTTSRRT